MKLIKENLNEQQSYIIGSIAAFVEAIILQPTLYWKNARAQNLPFTLNPRVIYRGSAISIFNECQLMGIQFGCTSYFHRILANRNDHDRKGMMIVSSILGGTFSSIFASPAELIMVQQQFNGGSIYAVTTRMINMHGYNIMMRGIIATGIREGLYVAGMLGVVPMMQISLIKDFKIHPQLAGFYASMVGGIASSLASQPFDLIKTVMQVDLPSSRYHGFLQTSRLLYQEGGIQRFFYGATWRAVNITGTIYIANECRIHLPDILF